MAMDPGKYWKFGVVGACLLNDTQKKLETFTRPPFLGLFQVSLTGKGLQPWPCHHVTPCVLMTQGVFFSGRELWPQTVAEPESEPDSGGQEDLVNGVSGKIWCWKKNNFYCRWSSKQQGACTPSPLSASQLLIYISVVAPFLSSLHTGVHRISLYMSLSIYLSVYPSTYLSIYVKLIYPSMPVLFPCHSFLRLLKLGLRPFALDVIHEFYSEHGSTLATIAWQTMPKGLEQLLCLQPFVVLLSQKNERGNYTGPVKMLCLSQTG